jgi:hypothetical protein
MSPSIGKRQREQAKKEKADAKRQRQHRPADAPVGEPPDEPVDHSQGQGETTGDLLDMIAELHRQFEAGLLPFADFETKKADLLARLVVD